jgi:hypothetical protein
METRCPILGSTTSLDIVSLCLILDDDECMLELSSCPYIHTKIRLQWLIDMDASWYIEKCPPTPHRTMKGCEHMICDRNSPHEVLPEEIWMFTDRDRHILEYHSLILEILSQAMIYHFTIILRPDSREHSALCLWDTQSIECIFYLHGDIIP